MSAGMLRRHRVRSNEAPPAEPAPEVVAQTEAELKEAPPAEPTPEVEIIQTTRKPQPRAKE